MATGAQLVGIPSFFCFHFLGLKPPLWYILALIACLFPPKHPRSQGETISLSYISMCCDMIYCVI